MSSIQTIGGDVTLPDVILDETIYTDKVYAKNSITGKMVLIEKTAMTGVFAIIDYPLLTEDAVQTFEIPEGKTAIEAHINDSPQYLQTANNATRGNTFTQSGTTITFAQATYIGYYISIKIQ